MKTIIWIMWPWEKATDKDLKNAYEIWKYSALKWYITLTWWRNKWVMNEWLKGAKVNWWLTLWILPSDDRSQFSNYLDIPVITTMKSWRNFINVLTSDIVVVCWIDAGTSSEISLAIKPWKKIILVWLYKEANTFYTKLAPTQVFVVKDYIEAINVLNSTILWNT